MGVRREIGVGSAMVVRRGNSSQEVEWWSGGELRAWPVFCRLMNSFFHGN